MKKLKNTILIASLVALGLTISVAAEMTTSDEALTIANNWINLVIQKKGDWGGYKTTAVEPGDLLTTSATPGYAVKATDYARAQGAILGKAMEKLEKGKKDQILVLVTLQ